MSENEPTVIYRKDYQVPDFLIKEVSLEFRLHEDDCVVRAKSVFERNPASGKRASELFLHGEGLELLSVARDGVELSPDQFVLSKKLQAFVISNILI